MGQYNGIQKKNKRLKNELKIKNEQNDDLQESKLKGQNKFKKNNRELKTIIAGYEKQIKQLFVKLKDMFKIGETKVLLMHYISQKMNDGLQLLRYRFYRIRG